MSYTTTNLPAERIRRSRRRALAALLVLGVLPAPTTAVPAVETATAKSRKSG